MPRRGSDRRSDRPEWQRWYKTARWQKARIAFLADHPLCVYCLKEGKTNAAQVVDHIEPHKGDAFAFWHETNWQPLCQPHHDGAKQKEELLGREIGCDAGGNPNHARASW